MDRRIDTAIQIMQSEIAKNLPVRDLASRVHLSQWHFIHLFKAETSLTPKQYILYLKMRRAEELLDGSFLSVKEIAANIGFGDRSHFSREFKKFRGATPSEIRERRKPLGALGNSKFPHQIATSDKHS